MRVPAATCTLRSTQFAPMLTPSPSTTSPSNTQLTSMATSRPQARLPRTSMRAGSASVTPSRINAAARTHWKVRSSSASCALLFTPRVSQAASGCADLTGTLAATAAATTSVR